ncbi:endonuclease [Neobacillus sp. FSL H8-0543]|uniref:endonuclease I family protein n=1 Tax=Neobacillus sp. FSL H8-0543 TaxID=2954672 RepID=UPI003158713A
MKRKRRKKKYRKIIWEKPEKMINLKRQLTFLRENTRKILNDQEIYYDEMQNQMDIAKYYQSSSKPGTDRLELFYQYHELLSETHKNCVPYFISKDLYLYTWVDLYPDGTVKSIYSGAEKDPEILIIEDYEIIRQRYEEFQHYLEKVNQNDFESMKELKAIEWKYRLNTEHIVPQSWFGAIEPMKGDLHHLFICEPECNIARSNFIYEDFNFYQPESPNEPIKNQCGVSNGKGFEPEFGKGAAARAMLYFLIRYPSEIKKAFRRQIDISLLAKWHQDFPVTLYERHRNQAIYGIQGNRNPFIDFPDLINKINFPVT